MVTGDEEDLRFLSGMNTTPRIEVADSDWGGGMLPDIEAVLHSCASQVTRHLRKPFREPVRVVPGTEPITLYRAQGSGPFTIELEARGQLWAKYAYQFAHEFCHALSGPERFRDNPNRWLHETICEVASIFCLRGMAKSWATNPPYSNWRDYSSALGDYAEGRMRSPEVQLPKHASLADWIAHREETLRADRYQRELNRTIAYRLLSIFEGEPTGWNAVPALPTATSNLQDYLAVWYGTVEAVDGPFVQRLSAEMCGPEASPRRDL